MVKLLYGVAKDNFQFLLDITEKQPKFVDYVIDLISEELTAGDSNSVYALVELLEALVKFAGELITKNGLLIVKAFQRIFKNNQNPILRLFKLDIFTNLKTLPVKFIVLNLHTGEWSNSNENKYGDGIQITINNEEPPSQSPDFNVINANNSLLIYFKFLNLWIEIVDIIGNEACQLIEGIYGLEDYINLHKLCEKFPFIKKRIIKLLYTQFLRRKLSVVEKNKLLVFTVECCIKELYQKNQIFYGKNVLVISKIKMLNSFIAESSLKDPYVGFITFNFEDEVRDLIANYNIAFIKSFLTACKDDTNPLYVNTVEEELIKVIKYRHELKEKKLNGIIENDFEKRFDIMTLGGALNRGEPEAPQQLVPLYKTVESIDNLPVMSSSKNMTPFKK